MIKVIIFLLILCAFAFGFSTLAELKGTLQLNFQDHVYEVSLTVALLLFLLTIVAAFLIFALFKSIIRSPKTALRMARERKKTKGFEALSQGLLSVTAGDFKSAERHAKDAMKFMPQEPLTLLLAAQTHSLGDNGTGAEKVYRTMLETPETKLIGLRGLHMEAERRNEGEVAKHIAEDAVKIAPSTEWAARSILKQNMLEGNFEEGLKNVDRLLQNRIIERSKARRMRAVLLTALATNNDNAKAMLQEVIGYEPHLVPAVTALAKIHVSEGNRKKALKLLEQAWVSEPQRELGEALFLTLKDDNNQEKLKIVKQFAALSLTHLESAFIAAKASYEAGDFAAAKEALKPFLETPTKRIALLMADISMRESNDYGLSKQWLSRAISAKPDKQWMSDGLTYEQWQPSSPITGEIDSFIWAEPPFDTIKIIEIEAPKAVVITPPTVVKTYAETHLDEVMLALPHPPDDPGVKQK